MNDKTLKPGDKVKLKSGGSIMVIHELTHSKENAVCVWHDKDDKPHREVYSLSSLELVVS